MFGSCTMFAHCEQHFLRYCIYVSWCLPCSTPSAQFCQADADDLSVVKHVQRLMVVWVLCRQPSRQAVCVTWSSSASSRPFCCEVLTGFFCEHAFEMARTEKESLIQDVVGPIVLGQCGSTLEIENRLAQAAGLWQIVMRLG